MRPRSAAAQTHGVAALAVLYGAYEVLRGFGGENWEAALEHTEAPHRFSTLS